MPNKLIYVVDDEENVRRLLEYWLKNKWGYDVKLFSYGERCLEALEAAPDLIILDIMLPDISGVDVLKRAKNRYPDLPIIVLSSQGRIEVAVEALKLGAIDYFPKSIEFPKLQIAVKNALQLYDLKREVDLLRESVAQTGRFDNIVSSAGPMEPVLKLVHKAKDSDISVLIQGESGTGKELIARAIHFNGKRKDGPFVAVNCAAIPRELIESEMFGHEKGAFTGAVGRKIGKFEQAHGGTIFLDEIGELDMNLQAKLLRAIQQRQFERVGGTELLTADVRIVSATHKDLVQASRDKEFREDLYYRLASFPIVLPPLRERRPDILLLAEHFLAKYSSRESKPVRSFSRRAVKMLYDYPWPGNVRELESAIERAIILCDGEVISEGDLPLVVQAFANGDDVTMPISSIFDRNDAIIPMERLKEQAIRHALKITEGNVGDAARRLKISRSTLYDLMKRFDVQFHAAA
jgi:DNA-binding NtrC family response regulator